MDVELKVRNVFRTALLHKELSRKKKTIKDIKKITKLYAK